MASFGSSFGSFGSGTGFGSGGFGGGGGGFGSSTFGSTPAFGSSSTPAFGSSFGSSSTPSFGGGGFGSSSTPAFGSSSAPTFGASTGSFGSSAPTFGASTGSFGSPSPFGGSSTSSGFGSTFGGGSNSFGTPSFGSSFGSGSGTSTFGGTSSTFGSGFGAPSSNTFGSFGSTPSTGMFGSGSSTFGTMGSSSFGSGLGNTFGSGNAFGSTSSTFGTGSSTFGTGGGFGSTGGFGSSSPFGSSSFGTFGGGGQKEKFQVTNHEGLQYHSISCMKSYSNKSFEELRWEQQGGTSATPALGFGSTASSTPFGTTTSTFGSTSSSPFGSSFGTGNSFGGTTGTSFGTGNGVFGSTTSSPFSFGTGTSTFGGSTSPFGGTSTFGSSFGMPSSTPSFGATSTFGTGGFGSSTPSFGTSFGTGSSGFGGFGMSTGTSFGSTTSGTSPFSFGASSPSFGAPSFGSTGSAFGSSTFGSTSFGSTSTFPSFGATTAPSTFGSTFGGTSFGAPSTSSFGAPSFGSPTTTGTSFGSTFGSPFGSSTFPTTSTFGATPFPSTATSFLGTQPPVKPPEVNDDPYGLLRLLPLDNSGPTPVGLTQPGQAGTPSTEPKSLIAAPTIYRVTPRSAARMRPRRYDRLSAPLALPAPLAPDRAFETPIDRPFREDFEAVDLSSRRSLRKLHQVHPPKLVEPDDSNIEGQEPAPSQLKEVKTKESPVVKQDTPVKSLFNSHDDSAYAPTPVPESRRVTPSPAKEPEKPRPPTLTREGYHTQPDIRELEKMSAEQLTKVKDFKVLHKKYGWIVWPGLTDVTGIDLDKVVHFGDNTLEVFPDQAAKVGHPLNKPAEVCFEGCWPENKDRVREPTTDEKKIKKYEARLHKMQKNMSGVHFLDYDPKIGRWRFSVDSF